MHTAIRRQTLSDLVTRSAARTPHKLAIACGDVRWSYAEFDALVTRVAAGLARHGIAKGTRVAVLARNSHAFAALRFGLARRGAVLVPINFMPKAAEVVVCDDIAACADPLPEPQLHGSGLLRMATACVEI